MWHVIQKSCVVIFGCRTFVVPASSLLKLKKLQKWKARLLNCKSKANTALRENCKFHLNQIFASKLHSVFVFLCLQQHCANNTTIQKYENYTAVLFTTQYIPHLQLSIHHCKWQFKGAIFQTQIFLMNSNQTHQRYLDSMHEIPILFWGLHSRPKRSL